MLPPNNSLFFPPQKYSIFANISAFYFALAFSLSQLCGKPVNTTRGSQRHKVQQKTHELRMDNKKGTYLTIKPKFSSTHKPTAGSFSFTWARAWAMKGTLALQIISVMISTAYIYIYICTFRS